MTSDVGADETRCLLLETTRQYAREQLAERGESEPTAERHARALLDLARDIAGNHATYNARLDRSPAVLRTMRAERANFDEALHWTLGRRANVRLGQELAWRIPFLRAADGLRWLRLALDAVGEGTPRELVAQMETQLGWCYIDVRDLHNAIATARRAVAAGRDHGDARTVAAAQRLLGRALAHAWNLDEAEVELRHSLSSFRELEDRRAIATTLSYLAFVAVRRGAHLQARRLNLEALDALGDGDERTARLIKIELARAEYGLGNYSVALALSRDVLPGLEAEAAEGGLHVRDPHAQSVYVSAGSSTASTMRRTLRAEPSPRRSTSKTRAPTSRLRRGRDREKSRSSIRARAVRPNGRFVSKAARV